MEETRVRGVIEIRERISSEIKKAQTTTREYMKTVKELQASLTKLEKSKGVDSTEFKKAKADLERYKQTLAKPAVMKVKADTKQAESTLSALKSKVASAFASVALGAAAANAVKTGFEYNAQLEQAQISWATILRDEKAATVQMQKLTQMAANSPFEFAGLDSAAKKLTMAGFSGEGLTTALRSVGDAVSAIGGGQGALDGISTALFQIYTKGKLSAEEMLQLAERGIPAWEILSKKMGVSMAELQKMTTDGKVMAQEVVPLLVEGLGERFGGAMEKQSKSMTGMLSTAKELVKSFFGNTTESAFATIKADVLSFNEALRGDEAKKYAKEVGQTLGSAVKFARDFAKVLWDSREAVVAVGVGFAAYKGVMLIEQSVAAAKRFKDSLDALLLGQKALNSAQAASPWGAIAIAVGLVAGAYTLLKAEAEKARKPITEMNEALKSAREEMESFKRGYSSGLAGVKVEFSQIKKQVAEIEELWNKGIRGEDLDLPLKSLLNTLPGIENAVEKINGKWDIQLDKIKSVLAEAENYAVYQYYQDKLGEIAVQKEQARTDEEVLAKIEAAKRKAEEDEAYAAKVEQSLSMDEVSAGFPSVVARREAERARKIAEESRAAYEKGVADYEANIEGYNAQSAQIQGNLDSYVALNGTPQAPTTPVTTTPAWSTALQDAAKPYMEEMQKYVKAQAALNSGEKGLAAAYLGMDADSKTRDMRKAIAEGQKETMREFALASLDQAKTILSEQGSTMESAQKVMLQNYIAQLTGALNNSATDMSTAISWLKTLRIPVDVKITTAGGTVTVETPTGTQRYYDKPNIAPAEGKATGTPYFKGGRTWVGERGAEYVELPAGTRITPAEHSANRERQVESGRGVTVMVTGNNFTVREEADIDRISDAIARRLEREVLCGA